GLSFRWLSMARLMTWDPQELAAAKLLLRAPVCHVGFGFARNTKHEHLGYGIIWAVVILAHD
ncbi:MAG: hypothetical protein ACOC8E_03720, partial [Planctomycetota bacterium]